ncbi:MAG: hypothetical protein KDA83_10120 [Planctomycetales bacterium]|nr:hypothetical protein [Planctomycetales bacterium]
MISLVSVPTQAQDPESPPAPSPSAPAPSTPSQGATESGAAPRVSARLIFSPPANSSSETPGVTIVPRAETPSAAAGADEPEREEPATAPRGGAEPSPRATVIVDPLAELPQESADGLGGYRSATRPRNELSPRVASRHLDQGREDDPPRAFERPSSLPDVNVWPNEGYEYLGEPIEMERLESLKARVRRTLMHYHQRPESTAEYSPWGVMHALIAFGADTEIIAGRRRVNAIGWLCWNGNCRNQRLMSARGGELNVAEGPGLQGHEGQLLAMLAQCYVPADFELRVDGSEFTVQDLIEYEQRTCKAGTELTFKLIAFSHYLPPDAAWVADTGEAWDIERLIQEEIKQPIMGAACGGTHRLMGLTYAVRYRRLAGLPLTGEWERADQYLRDYQQYAMSLQNPDGSFSTKWLERREAREDSQRRIQTTGHILEWMIYSLPEERLRSPEVVRTVNYLAQLMWDERATKWEIGPKGHALHALNLYDQRVFGAPLGQGGPRAEW